MGIRSLPIEVFPLSFSEYLRFNGILSEVPRVGFAARGKGVLRRAMSDYAERGGFHDVQELLELLGWDPWKNENLLTLLCYF